mgnify:FL=1
MRCNGEFYGGFPFFLSSSMFCHMLVVVVNFVMGSVDANGAY